MAEPAIQNVETGAYDSLLGARLAELRAQFPWTSPADHRLQLARCLRENTSLTISGARDEVEAFLRRQGFHVPPTPPGTVLFGIGLLGVIAAVLLSPVLTLMVSLVLLASGHSDLALRYWPLLLLGFGAGIGVLTILTRGPGLWRKYRADCRRRAALP